MKPPDDLGFVHVFVPADKPISPTLMLLHGTGGDERSLLPLGKELWPDAALLSIRGKVLENGMPRFFRRFAEGVFDVEDLKSRTEELAQFIDAASERYDFSKKRLIAMAPRRARTRRRRCSCREDLALERQSPEESCGIATGEPTGSRPVGLGRGIVRYVRPIDSSPLLWPDRTKIGSFGPKQRKT